MKDAKRASFAEFDKWRENSNKGAGIWTTAAYRKGWKAALEMIYYEGVLEFSLAGDLIERELNGDL